VNYSFHPCSGHDVGKLQAKFGQVIRRRRNEAGLGQEALADKAGLHRTHVSLLERGKRNPTLEVIKKLADALETTMALLLAELETEEDNEPEPAQANVEEPLSGKKKKR
jgi:transcriptional regulator with XRE-family HTH domain